MTDQTRTTPARKQPVLWWRRKKGHQPLKTMLYRRRVTKRWHQSLMDAIRLREFEGARCRRQIKRREEQQAYMAARRGIIDD